MNRVTFFPFLFPIVLIMEKLEQENLLESNWKYKKKSTFICYAKFFLHHHHHIIRPIACSVTCICFKARVHTYSRPWKCTGAGNEKKGFFALQLKLKRIHMHPIRITADNSSFFHIQFKQTSYIFRNGSKIAILQFPCFTQRLCWPERAGGKLFALGKKGWHLAIKQRDV